MLAVLADSASLARRDMEQACAFARSLGMPLASGRDRRTGPARVCAQRRQPLLPLQGRAISGDGEAGRETGFRAYCLRNECRRHAGFSARAACGRAACRAGAAGRGRADEAGSARAGQGGRLPGVGPSGGAVPLVARGIRPHGDARSAGAGGTRRREPAAIGFSRAARAAPRRAGARGDCAR